MTTIVTTEQTETYTPSKRRGRKPRVHPDFLPLVDKAGGLGKLVAATGITAARLKELSYHIGEPITLIENEKLALVGAR